ncbi:MAG TPA: L,D-transpeptidase, partial [Myxococcota bacterium]|nr:L,D-transpeptidase [Myxococcota bacterium]
LPYIPLEVPWVSTSPAPLSNERLYYAETRVALHAWPGLRFMRGFNSHGCITLRDGDLLELAAFVFGSEDPLPLTIRPTFEGALEARHPLPHEDKQYWRLVNTGTADRPAFSLRGTLYFLERLREPVPDITGFVGRFMDSERQAYRRGRLAQSPDAGIPESLIP